MADVPNTDNYTVPGGIKIFFNDGSGERDLGNIVGDSLTTSKDTETLEHFSNRSGTRLKDKIVNIEEAVQFDFNLDEVVIENLRYFFSGGAIQNVNSGTANAADQTIVANGVQFVSVGKDGISSVTARQFLQYNRVFDGISAFANNDTEMDTPAGVPYGLMSDTDDVSYLGKDTKYQQVYHDLAVLGDYTSSVTWEYWDGASWTVLVTGGADDLEASGLMTFTAPGDWALTSVDNQSAFWIRAQASTFVTQATANSQGRQLLTVNVDYSVDPGLATGINARKDGRLARLDAAGLYTDEAYKTTYDYVTFTSQTFAIAGSATVEGSARIEVHPSSGRGVSQDYTIPNCQLISNGNMDLNDSEFQEIPLSLVILDNSSASPVAPFGTVEVFDAQA